MGAPSHPRNGSKDEPSGPRGRVFIGEGQGAACSLKGWTADTPEGRVCVLVQPGCWGGKPEGSQASKPVCRSSSAQPPAFPASRAHAVGLRRCPVPGRRASPRWAVAFTHWPAYCWGCHMLTAQESGSGLCCPQACQAGGAAGQGAPRGAGGHLPLLSVQTTEISSSNSSNNPHVAVAKCGCLTH